MPKEILTLQDIQGSVRECGRLYGEIFCGEIKKFYAKEICQNKRNLRYAQACWKYIQDNAQRSAHFICGISDSTKISPVHLTLLLLHEEMVQQRQTAIPHCTAFVTQKKEVKDEKTVVGQNWDWGLGLYDYPGLLRMKWDKSPRTLTYHYPGLWASCGINENGLALMWTGGYNLPQNMSVGIPTYVLIAELLAHKTIEEALAYLNTIRNAGSFIFLLGDATGAFCVVEATPETHIIERSVSHLCRANHFMHGPTLAQKYWRIVDPKESIYRYNTLRAHLDGKSNITVSRLKTILTTPPLHGIDSETMTIDSIIAICQERTLLTQRGGNNLKYWNNISL